MFFLNRQLTHTARPPVTPSMTQAFTPIHPALHLNANRQKYSLFIWQAANSWLLYSPHFHCRRRLFMPRWNTETKQQEVGQPHSKYPPITLKITLKWQRVKIEPMCLTNFPLLSFILSANGRAAGACEVFRQCLRSDMSWWRRTVLEPQLPEEQGTLEDVTSARLIFPRHQHQVCVDEDRHLQQPRWNREKNSMSEAWESARLFEGTVHILSPAAFPLLTNVRTKKVWKAFSRVICLQMSRCRKCTCVMCILKNYTNTHTNALLLGI